MPLYPPPAGSGAPADADYLVGTANGTLSAEIAVGTSPGGELGGTWASPTVDATHSGSAHHTQAHVVTGADHTASGLTIGHVLTASSATAFGFAAPAGGAPTLISSGAAPAAGAASTAAAPSETWLLNTADNGVTTVETVMSLTGLLAGTYLYEYFIVWRSGATGTGTAFAVDYTGTVTRTRMTRHYQSTGASAATGVADGVSAVLTGTLVEHMSAVSDNGALGPMTGVASTTEDQFDYIRGIMVVSNGGDLNLTMTGEGNGAVTFKADSLVLLKRMA